MQRSNQFDQFSEYKVNMKSRVVVYVVYGAAI